MIPWRKGGPSPKSVPSPETVLLCFPLHPSTATLLVRQSHIPTTSGSAKMSVQYNIKKNNSERSGCSTTSITKKVVKYSSRGSGQAWTTFSCSNWYCQQWEDHLRASSRKPLSLGDLLIALGYKEKSIGLPTSLFALFVCRELSQLGLGGRQAIT